MTFAENIKRYIQNLNNICDQIRIVEKSSSYDFLLVDNAILIAFASWSGPALSNFIQTIKLVNEKCYRGQILIIDIDEMTPDLQYQTFGVVCHGWAEIFVIQNGKVVERFLGKSCFENFRSKVGILQC